MMHPQTAECYKYNYSVCEGWGILWGGEFCMWANDFNLFYFRFSWSVVQTHFSKKPLCSLPWIDRQRLFQILQWLTWMAVICGEWGAEILNIVSVKPMSKEVFIYFIYLFVFIYIRFYYINIPCYTFNSYYSCNTIRTLILWSCISIDIN